MASRRAAILNSQGREPLVAIIAREKPQRGDIARSGNVLLIEDVLHVETDLMFP